MRNSALLFLLALTGCWSDSTKQDFTTAEEKAIEFLKREVPAWSRENGCFSCHNNGDGARALYAASRRGHRVPARALDDTTGWVTAPAHWEHNKGDPGFSDQRLANIQFAASLLAARESGRVKDRESLRDAARKVAADQNADGSWPVERHNPVGSPATYGATLATFMAWQILTAAEIPEGHDAARKAETWLHSVRPINIPNAAVLMMMAGRQRKPVPIGALEFLRAAQSPDGGWGPYRDSPPEVFDTALALLALAETSGEGAGGMIQRGRSFLQAQQLRDGSWPATTRPSGGQSYAQQISTTGWATLALLQTSDVKKSAR